MAEKEPDEMKDRLQEALENKTVPSQAGFNRKMFYIAGVALVSFIAVGFTLYMKPAKPKESLEEKLTANPSVPGILDLDSAYGFLKPKNDPEEDITELENPDIEEMKEDKAPVYASYAGDGVSTADFIPEENKQDLPPRSTPPARQNNTYVSQSPVSPPAPEYRQRSAGIYAVYNTSRDFNSSTGTNYEYMPSKEEVLSQTDFQKQNMQYQKMQFLASASDDYNSYLSSRETDALSPGTEIKAGSFIPVILKSGINSDLPGDVTGQVSHDVYDTATGNNVLIPAGSLVYGQYDSNISSGQHRVLVVWNRIILLDGRSINIEGMQATGPDGKIGIVGKYSAHYDEIAIALGASTAFDVGTASFTAWLSGLPGMGNLGDAVENTAGKSEEVANQIFDKIINQQPTINVEPGTLTNIHVNKDIILSAYNR